MSSVSNSAAASALGQLGLADTGRAEEDERSDRPPRVLDARAGPDDGVGDELDRLVLADHALVEDLVEPQQLLRARLPASRLTGMPVQRDTIDGDLLLGDHLAQQPRAALLGGQLLLLGGEATLELGELAEAQLGGAFEVVGALGLIGFVADPLDLLAQRLHLLQRLALGLPLGPHRVGLGPQVGKLLAQLLQALLAGLVLLLGQRRLLDLETGHAPGQLVELGRHRVDLGAQHRAGFVDEIDRLVGQESIGDVAVAQHNRRDEGGVLDLHAVEHLEPLAQTAQDGDRVLHRRLVDDNRLEAPLQARRPSRRACGTRRASSRRSCAARRGRASA